MGAGSFAAGWLRLCFPNFAIVYTPNGPKKVSELQIGEEVKVMQHDNTVGWSPVIGWCHKDIEQDASFLELMTSTQQTITLSPDHLLPVVRNGKKHRSLRHHEVDGAEYMKAGEVVQGDSVLQVTTTASGEERFQCVPVTSARTIESRGIFAPLTMTGTVVVDNIAASCYASVPSHAAAHAAVAPVRAAFELRPKTVAKHHEEREGKQFRGASNYVDRLGRLQMRVLHPRRGVECTV
jgi:hypothetical protein